MDIVCAETDATEGAGGVEGVADGVDIVDGVVVAEGGVDGLDGWGLVCAITAPPISDEANDATINFFIILLRLQRIQSTVVVHPLRCHG